MTPKRKTAKFDLPVSRLSVAKAVDVPSLASWYNWDLTSATLLKKLFFYVQIVAGSFMCQPV